MAGIGSAWGTREELLHPRDRNGRFRKKWSMAKGVVDALTGFLDRYQPRQFQSDGQAAQYTFNNRKDSWGQEDVRRLHMDWDDANESLQAGEMDDTTKRFVDMMDRHMAETTDDLIMSQTVPPAAFGLSPQQMALEEGGLEDFIGLEIADAGYTAMNIGSELSHPPGSITLRVAVPKGTRVAFGGRSPNDRGVFMDRDQPLVVTKVEPDGRGGYYMLAIAGSGRKTPGATAVADDRTFGRRGQGLTPEQREARVTPPAFTPEQRRRVGMQGEREAQQETLRGIQARGEEVPAPAPAPAAPASPQAPAPPATGVPERREPVQSEAVGPGSPEGKSASDIATEARAPQVQAEAAPTAPVAPTGAEFREIARDLGVPSAGPQRQQWNNAYRGILRGNDPGDTLRELDSDIESNKARVAQVGDPTRRDELERNIQAQEALADTISENYGVPRRATSAPVERRAPAATPGAPSTQREATPRAPAPRKVARRAPQEVADQMKSVTSRQEGDALLQDLTGPELHAVAEAAEISVPKRATKAQLRQTIGQHGYGRRLDSDAISGNARRMSGDMSTDTERRVVARAKAIRARKPEEDFDSEDRRIVDLADSIEGRAPAKKAAAKKAVPEAAPETAPEAPAPAKKVAKKAAPSKAVPGTETRSEMRKRTAGPGLTDEQKADVKAKAERANERARREMEDFDAKNKADLDPLLEAAGLQEGDLDDLDKTGANLILGQVREKKISKVEGVRRLKASNSPRLQALGDALAARPRKVAAKKAPAKKAVPNPNLSNLSDDELRKIQESDQFPQRQKDAMQEELDARAAAKKAVPAKKAVAKKATPAKAVPEVSAEDEAFKARVAEAGLPDRVTELRAMARDQKIRGFSTMNKKQLQSALLGDEVPRAGKIAPAAPKKLVPHLQAAKSDQEARRLLENHTLADLRAMAKDDSVGVSLPSRGVTKDKAKDAILKTIRGGPEGGKGETPARSLRQELDAQKWVEPADSGVAGTVRGIISDTDEMDAADLRNSRDALEAMVKTERSKGNRQDANLIQTLADTMGMRAQTISGVEEGAPPVKRVAKKAAPAVPEGEEAPEVERPLEKMLKPELLALAQREGASTVRSSWTKPRILEEIKKNRRMDSSRGQETDEERQRRELGAVPGGAERDLGPQAGPLRLPDRAPTLEEIQRDNPDLDIQRMFDDVGLPKDPGGIVSEAQVRLTERDGGPESAADFLRSESDKMVDRIPAARKFTQGRSGGASEVELEEQDAQIRDEAARIRDIADKIEAAPPVKKVAKRAAGQRRVSPIDPVALFTEGGEAGLRERLAGLSDDQLRDVVAGNGMDTGRRSGKWDRDRLSDLIVERSQARATKGEAFRAPTKRAAKKAVDQAADTISGQLKETFGDQLRQEDPDSVRDSVRAVGLEPKGNTSEEIFDNALKDMLENRMRELGMLPEDPAKPTRAQKRVPKGSVKGPKADVPIAAEGRRSSFTEAWDDQGFADDASLNEIRDRVASGELTHEEGVRRIESEISFNEEEISDLGAELRGMAPEDRDSADGIHARRAELQDKITSQKKAAKFLRDYSRDEAPVTQEELESKLDGAEKAALQRVEVDDLKAAAKAEGLGDIDGDDKDTVVQNIAKKMQAREEKARQRQVRIKERGEVASSLSNLDQMAQNEGSDRALEAGIRRLPEADRQRLTDALGDREQFRRELDAITSEHGLTRVGKAGDTVAYNPDIHEVMGDVAPGSPVLIARAGHSFKPGDGSTVNFKARAIPDEGAQIPARAPEAPAKTGVSTPGQPPVKAAPGTAAGRITTSRLTPGTRILVERGKSEGSAMPTTRKTGSIPVTVTRVEGARGEGKRRSGYIVTVTDDNGNELKLGLRPGSQTHMLEPAPKAAKAAKATKKAVPTPEAPTAPEAPAAAKKATKKVVQAVAKAAIPAKATPKPVVDLDNPTRHDAEVIGTGLDLDPKGEDRQWLDVVQRSLDRGEDGRQIADGLRREADSQRTLHNIQESVGGTEGSSPAARINRMELMADRLEGVRPIKKAAPAKAAKAADAPDKREMDTMQAATAQSDALRDLSNGKSHAEVATKLRQRATQVGSREHDPQTVRPLEFTPAERSAMKRNDAKKLRELAAEIQAQGVAQRAEARAAKKAAPKKARPSAADDAVATALMDRIEERDPAVAKAVLAEISPEDRKELDAARERDAARKAAKAAAPKKRTAAEMRRARNTSEMEGVPVDEVLARWDQQKLDRKNLTGPVGEMIAAQIEDAHQALLAADTPRAEGEATGRLLHPELRTWATKLGLSPSGTKAVLEKRIADRVKGREAPGASAERAVPKAPGGRTTQPPKPHSWGTFGQRGDQHYYHPDGLIPRTMDRLGGDGQIDVGGGESLHNAMGDIATDMVMGRVTADVGVSRLQALGKKLPENSSARGTVEALVRDLHAPMVGMPDLPTDTPALMRQLLDQIRTGFPIARATGHFGSATYEKSLVDKIADFIRVKASGNASVVGMDRELADLIQNHSHESQEGSMGLRALANPLFNDGSEISQALRQWAKEIRARRSQ